MKVKALSHGNDGTREYAAGDVLEDSDHARSLLASGLAEPADKAAEALATDKGFLARHHKEAFAGVAAELKRDGAKAAKRTPK